MEPSVASAMSDFRGLADPRLPDALAGLPAINFTYPGHALTFAHVAARPLSCGLSGVAVRLVIPSLLCARLTANNKARKAFTDRASSIYFCPGQLGGVFVTRIRKANRSFSYL